jgi:hypothetical protein
MTFTPISRARNDTKGRDLELMSSASFGSSSYGAQGAVGDRSAVARRANSRGAAYLRLQWVSLLALNYNLSFGAPFYRLQRSTFRPRLRSNIGKHTGRGTNAKHGTKQRAPRRTQQEHEDKRKHQKRFSKCALSAAFEVDIEHQWEEQSQQRPSVKSRTPRSEEGFFPKFWN